LRTEKQTAILIRGKMWLNNAHLILSNPRLPDLKPVEVKALADTGATHLCIPEHIRLRNSGLKKEKRKKSSLPMAH